MTEVQIIYAACVLRTPRVFKTTHFRHLTSMNKLIKQFSLSAKTKLNNSIILHFPSCCGKVMTTVCLQWRWRSDLTASGNSSPLPPHLSRRARTSVGMTAVSLRIIGFRVNHNFELNCHNHHVSVL